MAKDLNINSQTVVNDGTLAADNHLILRAQKSDQ